MSRSLYHEWEAKLGIALADAQKALPAADYARLCEWMAQVCLEERDLIPTDPEDD